MWRRSRRHERGYALSGFQCDLPQLGEPGQVTGPLCHIYFRDQAPAAGLRVHMATVIVTVMGAVVRKGEGPLII